MSWVGKILGGAFGFMLGGPLGAMAGAAFGHQFDAGYKSAQQHGSARGNFNERERTQTAFFTATFAVMGHVAKADGQVTPDEIQNARQVMAQMRLSPELEHAAKHLFSEGKAPAFPLDDILDQLRRECHQRHRLLRMFMEIQFQAAYADGHLHTAEKKVLLHIADRLGFTRREFDSMESMADAERQFRGHSTPRSSDIQLGDAYALLQVPRDADMPTVKKAYRKLMSQHHPDKLVAKGLPEEMIKLATKKTQEIKAAYDKIKSAA